jgi:hypothetical protein
MTPEPVLIANSIDAIYYRLMELIKDFPSGKVLDLPSGWGRLSYWLKVKGYNVISCDITPETYTESPIEQTYANLNERFRLKTTSSSTHFVLMVLSTPKTCSTHSGSFTGF